MRFVNFYRKFVSRMTQLMESLIDLTKKGKKWEWEKKEKEAFEKTRESLLKRRILRTFNSEKSIQIEIDASDHITAAIMNQKQQPVEFMSKKMNTTKQNYIITEKEMLAVIQAVKK